MSGIWNILYIVYWPKQNRSDLLICTCRNIGKSCLYFSQIAWNFVWSNRYLSVRSVGLTDFVLSVVVLTGTVSFCQIVHDFKILILREHEKQNFQYLHEFYIIYSITLSTKCVIDQLRSSTFVLINSVLS